MEKKEKDIIDDTSKTFCSILFDVFSGHGIRDVVCSPGSRNAPLLVAAAARPMMRKHVVADERSAAFMAMGMSMIGRKPVVLVCTSGTALLNYAPAVAEAYYQGLPLIVVSADRPQQWIDQDDSQTLRQHEALGNYVKKSYELPAYGDEEKELQWFANRVANDAVLEATTGKPGPVHINVRLGEPLGNKVEREIDVARLITMIKADTIENEAVRKELAEKAANSKILLVCGFMLPDARLNQVLLRMEKLPNVAIMAETISNLHPYDHNVFSIDKVLTGFDAATLDAATPDLVISIGGALVSRKLKEYLRRNCYRTEHWQVGWGHTTADCFMALTKRIEISPARFLQGIVHDVTKLWRKSGEPSEPVSQYKLEWNNLRYHANRGKNKVLDEVPWCELDVFRTICNGWNLNSNVVLSNGTAIRYAQLFGEKQPHACYCNRGVSGIDGALATAIGAAKRYPGPTLLVTGDLSMAYDVGSFGIEDIPDTLNIVVIDNQGGGIFRFVPSTSGLEERERYFCASPDLPLKDICRGYGWAYEYAATKESFDKAYTRLNRLTTRRTLLHVRVDGQASAEWLKNYMAAKAE